MCSVEWITFFVVIVAVAGDLFAVDATGLLDETTRLLAGEVGDFSCKQADASVFVDGQAIIQGVFCAHLGFLENTQQRPITIFFACIEKMLVGMLGEIGQSRADQSTRFALGLWAVEGFDKRGLGRKQSSLVAVCVEARSVHANRDIPSQTRRRGRLEACIHNAGLGGICFCRSDGLFWIRRCAWFFQGFEYIAQADRAVFHEIVGFPTTQGELELQLVVDFELKLDVFEPVGRGYLELLGQRTCEKVSPVFLDAVVMIAALDTDGHRAWQPSATSGSKGFFCVKLFEFGSSIKDRLRGGSDDAQKGTRQEVVKVFDVEIKLMDPFAQEIFGSVGGDCKLPKFFGITSARRCGEFGEVGVSGDAFGVPRKLR